MLHASERFEAEPAGLACGVDRTPVHVDAVVVHAAKNLIGQLEAVFDVGGVYEFDTLHRFAAAVRLEIDMAVRRLEQKRTLAVVGARDFNVAVDAGKNGAAFAAAVIGKVRLADARLPGCMGSGRAKFCHCSPFFRQYEPVNTKLKAPCCP